MRISTNEFLLGSLNDLLAQQQTVNQLNREIATGETLLDASSDPGGAGQVIGLANQIGTLSYDAANGQAATQTLQNGVSTLQQVTNLLDQLQQSATAAANGTTTPSERQSDISNAQALLQQLVQLANTQGANGDYLFAGLNRTRRHSRRCRTGRSCSTATPAPTRSRSRRRSTCRRRFPARASS